jgi:hypothetical protein
MAARASVSLAVVTAVLWLSTVGKLLDPYSFVTAIMDLGIPLSLAWPLSMGVVVVEGSLAVLLLVRRYRLVGLFLSGSLFLLFAAFNAFQVLAGRMQKCACFGALWSRQLDWWTVAEDFACAGLAWYVLSSRRSHVEGTEG